LLPAEHPSKHQAPKKERRGKKKKKKEKNNLTLAVIAC
jgi:predicted GIY-YIG superfamily endonuclease